MKFITVQDLRDMRDQLVKKFRPAPIAKAPPRPRSTQPMLEYLENRDLPNNLLGTVESSLLGTDLAPTSAALTAALNAAAPDPWTGLSGATADPAPSLSATPPAVRAAKQPTAPASPTPTPAAPPTPADLVFQSGSLSPSAGLFGDLLTAASAFPASPAGVPVPPPQSTGAAAVSPSSPASSGGAPAALPTAAPLSTTAANGGAAPAGAIPLALTLDVQPTPTTTSLSSNVNPSAPGQAVTFTVYISSQSGSGFPTGTVTFMDGATTLGSVSVAAGIMTGTGTATFTTSALSLGSHSITAVYGGDALYAGSTGALTQSVQKVATSSSLSSNVNPSAPGQAVTLTAYLSSQSGSGYPTGTVTFMDGATTLGSVSVAAGIMAGTGTATFTTSALSLGSHSITAVYGGDATYAGSTSNALTQTVQLVTTETLLSSDINPSPFNQSVTFTAWVSGPYSVTPTGTVTFYDGATVLGTPSVTAGIMAGTATATFASYDLAVGYHSITALYSGDSTYATSTSTAYTQAVDDAGIQTNYDGDRVSLQVGATVPTSFAGVGLPPGLSIDAATGLISGTISDTADVGGPYTSTVTATVGSFSNSETFLWFVNNPIPLYDLDQQDVLQGSVVNLKLGGNDADGGTPSYSATGLPVGLAINATTGAITGTVAAVGTYASTILATDGRFSNSLALNWNVLALGAGVNLLAAPAQSVSMIAKPADVFTGPSGAYALPLNFQLANPSLKGGYMIVHVFYNHNLEADPKVLKSLGYPAKLQSDFYEALHVSAGNTTADTSQFLYDPNTNDGQRQATANGWQTMTDPANVQFRNANPIPKANIWSRMGNLGPTASGNITVEGDVSFLEGATLAALANAGFALGTDPAVAGTILLRQAAGYGPVQVNLATAFNGTSTTPYGFIVNWNPKETGGATQVTFTHQ